MRFLKEERGVSLVEVVASIVLVTIILLSFFGFFVNSAKHTKFNEDKLTSIEIAENIIATIRSNPIEYRNNVSNKEVNVSSEYISSITIIDGPNALLKKATIKVKPMTGKGIKQSPFITHIYYEVP